MEIMKRYLVQWTIVTELDSEEYELKSKQDARERAKETFEEVIVSEGIPLTDIQVKIIK